MRSLLSHFWRMVLTGGTRGLRLVSVLGVAFALLGFLIAVFLVDPPDRPHPVPVQGWTSLIGRDPDLHRRDPVLARRDRGVRRRRGQHGDGQAALPDHPGPCGRAPWPATPVHAAGSSAAPACSAAPCAVGCARWAARCAPAGSRGPTTRPPCAALLARRRTAAVRDWQLYWCAGAGVVGTRPGRAGRRGGRARGVPRLAGEPVVGARCGHLPRLLGRWGVRRGGRIRRSPRTPRRSPSRRTATPSCAPRPPWTPSPAARATPLLVGRLSNLYGPGQDLAKPQGLISQLCRAQLTRRPLSIYVSLDTRRDYLFVDDAAAMVVAGARRGHRARGAPPEGARQRAFDDDRRGPRRPAPDHPSPAAGGAGLVGQRALPGASTSASAPRPGHRCRCTPAPR